MAYGRRDPGVSVAALAAFVLLLVGLSASPAWAAPVLDVQKSDNPDPVRRGELLTYTIVVRNTGPDPAGDVQLEDILPADVEFDSASSGCTETAGTVSCDLNGIAPNNSRTVTIRARVDAVATTPISNMATATDNDNLGVTDSDTEETTVVPNLDIEKRDDPDPVNDPGDVLLYTLRVENRDDAPVTGVIVRDDLPERVRFISVDSNDFDCEENGGLVRCTGELEAANDPDNNDIGVVRIAVDAREAGTIRNTAEVRFNDGTDTFTVDEDTEETVVREVAVSTPTDPTPTDPTDPTPTDGNVTGEVVDAADDTDAAAADDATSEATTADAAGDSAEEICASSESVRARSVLFQGSFPYQYQYVDENAYQYQYVGFEDFEYLVEDFDSQFIIDCVDKRGSGVLDKIALDELPDTGGLPVAPFAGLALVGAGLLVARGLRERP